MSTDDELRAALQDVVKAAREWRANTQYSDTEALTAAVDALNKLMENSKAPQGLRRWVEVRAGWFVQTPKGDWLEVVRNKPGHYDGRLVTVLINGSERTLTRQMDEKVMVRRSMGGAPSNPEEEAMRAIMDAFPETVVLEDWS